MGMKDFAEHIIGVAQEHDRPITNLQLQKVMYFSLQYALRNHLLTESDFTRMYDSPFEVWRYGPVERRIYEKYRVYGSEPITENNDVAKYYRSLDQEITRLLAIDPFALVKESQQELFWQKHESEISGWRSAITYELGTIKAGYTDNKKIRGRLLRWSQRCLSRF